MVFHVGNTSPSAGHYFSVVYKGGKYFRCDDENVCEIPSNLLGTAEYESNCYLIFLRECAQHENDSALHSEFFDTLNYCRDQLDGSTEKPFLPNEIVQEKAHTISETTKSSMPQETTLTCTKCIKKSLGIPWKKSHTRAPGCVLHGTNSSENDTKSPQESHPTSQTPEKSAPLSNPPGKIVAQTSTLPSEDPKILTATILEAMKHSTDKAREKKIKNSGARKTDYAAIYTRLKSGKKIPGYKTENGHLFKHRKKHWDKIIFCPDEKLRLLKAAHLSAMCGGWVLQL